MEVTTPIVALTIIKNDMEQAGREIYYAMTHLSPSSPARVNLRVALKLLGIHSPSQIGLSDSVLSKRQGIK